MKIIERDLSPEDLIYRLEQRAYRNKRRGHPPKPRPSTNRDRSRELDRAKKIRSKRLRDRICTARGDQIVTDGYRYCPDCRQKWRGYNARCNDKKILSLTTYSLKIDLE